MTTTLSERKNIGLPLTIWLAIVIFLNGLSLVMGAVQLLKVSGATQVYTLFLILLSLLGIVGAVMLFLGRKLGLWIVIGAALLGFIVNLLVHQLTGAGLIALLLALVTAILAWPKLKFMR